MSEVILRAGWSAGQFSDVPKAQRQDAHRLAQRMQDRGWHFLGGTEAGSKSVLAESWRGIDQDFGLKFYKGQTGDVWIVTQRDLFKGEVETSWYKVLDGKAGQYADRGYLRVTGYCPLVKSKLTILSSHWLTNDTDRDMADGPGNQKLADVATRLGFRFGANRKLCFLGLDANRSERERMGLLRDAAFRTLAEETGRIQNTGHGPIDALSRFKNDTRVHARSWRVFDDSEFPLHTDHYLCEGSWTVQV